ncbi:MAG: glycosyltransferase family 39 protein, partial [Candidatus Binatus sp.]|uniref:ArnT family glycosyltransferase n=1 Tax=Candidatus Binatus sp. TaxID=2811406 RepID=UPI003C736061
IDAALIALLLGFAMLMIANTGFANGQELWPMPDAVEYAATAVNLDRGLGPVLHFGGNTYPSRYTIGYPLILAAAYPILGRKPERLCLVTALTALIAIAGLYLLTLWVLDRPSAIVAGLLLATSPHFLGLSTCVLSDVPSLAVVILAVLTFLYAEEKQSLAASALCGILVGLAVTIRVTNGAILIGMIAAALLVQPRRAQFVRVTAFAIGFIVFPGLQTWLNLRYLGSPLSNGYAFWLPQYYSSVFQPFKLSYLVMPPDPSSRHGNSVTYAIAMLGLDGVLGQLTVGTELRTLIRARYALYPFPVVIFAGLGVFFALHRKRSARMMRAVYLGLGFLASLLLIYLLYFCVDPRFMLPALFIVFSAAGYGLISANRRLERGWVGFAVIALDVVLAGAVVVQTVSRLATPLPQNSKLVADVLAIRPRLANAVVVTDISLQWIELYAGGEQTEFVGLNNLYTAQVPDQIVTEYHLYLLDAKKSAGWSGPIPPVLFPRGELDSAEAHKLADEDRHGRPVYALISKPLTREWQSVLQQEAAEIDRYFTDETVADYPEVGLYRLTPR